MKFFVPTEAAATQFDAKPPLTRTFEESSIKVLLSVSQAIKIRPPPPPPPLHPPVNAVDGAPPFAEITPSIDIIVPMRKYIEPPAPEPPPE